MVTPVGARPIAAAAAPRTASVLSSARFRRNLEVWLVRLVLIVIIVAALFPVAYVVLSSIKGGSQSLFSASLIPESVTFGNYRRLIEGGRFPRWVLNSLVLGIASGFLQVFFATLAGYAFSRMRFKGRRYGILLLLIIQMLPVNMALVAYFYILRQINLYDSLVGSVWVAAPSPSG